MSSFNKAEAPDYAVSDSGVKKERKAAMSPAAVKKAQVFTGPVYYYDAQRGERIVVDNTQLVEVGRWTEAGVELTAKDYLCTYHSAIAAGYGHLINWLPAGGGGERKLLIAPGFDDDGKIESFTVAQAHKIANHINRMLTLAKAEHVEV